MRRNGQATTHHISHVVVAVVHHRILERLEEVFLKFEVGELLFLQEARRELPERVEGEVADLRVGMAADLCVVIHAVLEKVCKMTRAPD